MSIALMTFDIFGTVLDWQAGLRQALGGTLSPEGFDQIVDRQAELEQEAFRPYTEIVAQSLVDELGLGEDAALGIAREAGRWPLFPDSADALLRLSKAVPCAATTNSDVDHGAQVRGQLGLHLRAWVCSEETRVYKPDAEVWREAGRRVGVAPGKDWWHVSAYGDYDLQTARALGLTCVLVRRPHCRPGPADVEVQDLTELAALVERGQVERRTRDLGPAGRGA